MAGKVLWFPGTANGTESRRPSLPADFCLRRPAHVGPIAWRDPEPMYPLMNRPFTFEYLPTGGRFEAAPPGFVLRYGEVLRPRRVLKAFGQWWMGMVGMRGRTLWTCKREFVERFAPAFDGNLKQRLTREVVAAWRGRRFVLRYPFRGIPRHGAGILLYPVSAPEFEAISRGRGPDKAVVMGSLMTIPPLMLAMFLIRGGRGGLDRVTYRAFTGDQVREFLAFDR